MCNGARRRATPVRGAKPCTGLSEQSAHLFDNGLFAWCAEKSGRVGRALPSGIELLVQHPNDALETTGGLNSCR